MKFQMSISMQNLSLRRIPINEVSNVNIHPVPFCMHTLNHFNHNKSQVYPIHDKDLSFNLVPSKCNSGNAWSHRSTKHECWISPNMVQILERGKISVCFLVLYCIWLLGHCNISLIEIFHLLHQFIFCMIARCNHLQAAFKNKKIIGSC